MAVYTKKIVICDICGREIKNNSPMIVYQTGTLNGFNHYGNPVLFDKDNGTPNYTYKKYVHIRASCLRRIVRKTSEQYLSKPITLSNITEIKTEVEA